MTLQEQIRFFEQNHYCVMPNALSHTECERINALCDRHRRDFPDLWGKGGQSQSVHCILNLPELDYTIQHPSFFPLARTLLDDDIVFGEISVLIRPGVPPGQERDESYGSWHRDFPINPKHRLGVTMLSAIIYLTDVDRTTARYALIPSSQAREQEPQRIAPDADDYVGEAEMLGAAGTCILVNSGIWHRAKFGGGPRDRRSIHLYYQSSNIPQQAAHNIVPRRLWDVDDAEQRRFFSHFNHLTEVVVNDYLRDAAATATA